MTYKIDIWGISVEVKNNMKDVEKKRKGHHLGFIIVSFSFLKRTKIEGRSLTWKWVLYFKNISFKAVWNNIPLTFYGKKGTEYLIFWRPCGT